MVRAITGGTRKGPAIRMPPFYNPDSRKSNKKAHASMGLVFEK